MNNKIAKVLVTSARASGKTTLTLKTICSLFEQNFAKVEAKIKRPYGLVMNNEVLEKLKFHITKQSYSQEPSLYETLNGIPLYVSEKISAHSIRIVYSKEELKEVMEGKTT